MNGGAGVAGVTPRLLRLAAPALGGLVAASCVFDTETPRGRGPALSFLPDLHGPPRMHVTRQFLRPGGGPDGDTALSFIRYSWPGDTVIAGQGYRLMREEELALRNFDQGLRIYESAFAVRVSGDSVFANQLGSGQAYGKLAFKTAAPDTLPFEDQRVPLIGKLQTGSRWMSRKPGPSGSGAEFKTYLGRQPLDWKRADSGEAFAVSIPEQSHLRVFEWYRGGSKIFASTVYASGADSIRLEEEFQSERGFTGADTLAARNEKAPR